jgi:hypothetical protein
VDHAVVTGFVVLVGLALFLLAGVCGWLLHIAYRQNTRNKNTDTEFTNLKQRIKAMPTLEALTTLVTTVKKDAAAKKAEVATLQQQLSEKDATIGVLQTQLTEAQSAAANASTDPVPQAVIDDLNATHADLQPAVAAQ